MGLLGGLQSIINGRRGAKLPDRVRTNGPPTPEESIALTCTKCGTKMTLAIQKSTADRTEAEIALAALIVRLSELNAARTIVRVKRKYVIWAATLLSIGVMLSVRFPPAAGVIVTFPLLLVVVEGIRRRRAEIRELDGRLSELIRQIAENRQIGPLIRNR